MFFNFNGLKKIENIELLDTSNIENMNSAFKQCENLEELNLSNNNLIKVKDMNNMFKNCKKIVSIKMGNMKPSRIANTFCNCIELRNLNAESFIISSGAKVFYNCKNLIATINLGNETFRGDFINEIIYNCTTIPPAKLVLNYTSETATLIDEILATKSENSNVVNGELIE